jgi:hypothetical protein
MDFFSIIFMGLFGLVGGVHLGIFLLAEDLKFQNRMNENEFKYVTSWNYTWTLLDPRTKDDTE